MTDEEFRNIENMPFKEVCEFLGVKPTTIIAKNLDCTKCPLFKRWFKPDMKIVDFFDIPEDDNRQSVYIPLFGDKEYIVR